MDGPGGPLYPKSTIQKDIRLLMERILNEQYVVPDVHEVPVPLQVYIAQKSYNIRVMRFLGEFSTHLQVYNHSEHFMAYIPHNSCRGNCSSNVLFSEEKWAYHIIERNTPHVHFWTTTNVFASVKIFRIPYPNITAVNTTTHEESGFVRKKTNPSKY